MGSLAIIGIFYKMHREAPRTIHSLTQPYQQALESLDYELVLVDNGSKPAMPMNDYVANYSDVRAHQVSRVLPSPAFAINEAVRATTADYVGILIDGARMATPGLVASAMKCLRSHRRAVVGTVGFHLGPDNQSRSVEHGYNQEVEDALLAKSNWQANGYELFGISAFAGSCRTGWLNKIVESNLIFMHRDLYDELGGYDERFDIPGGGLVNLDFYKRATELPESELFTLLGEGTFHQFHGGTMTNSPSKKVSSEMGVYREQYRGIRGVDYEHPKRIPTLYGQVDSLAVPHLHRGAAIVMADKKLAPIKPPDYSKQLSFAEAKGGDKQAGDEHYRAYVGRPEHYDIAAGIQFSLLCMLGLREEHKLLDVGCGSLRGGRLFIPYLAPGGYSGLEPNRWLVEQGLKQEVGAQLRKLKQPNFAYNDSFDLSRFTNQFDYVLAQSIFSHTGPTQLARCLKAVSEKLSQSGLLVATFVERKEDLYEDVWVYPGLNHFSWATVQRHCTNAGLRAVKLDWPHTLQTWFVAARSAEPLEKVYEGPVETIADDVILTGPRYKARHDGRPLQFYRQLKSYC